MKERIVLIIIGLSLLAIGCAAPNSYFGVQNRAYVVPDEFAQTESVVQKAEKSEGAQYCPDKIDRAKALGKEAVQIYWACRTKEALAMLAESRKLAEEAMECKPAPKPAEPAKPTAVSEPSDKDGDGVPDYKDECPDTPAGIAVNKIGCPLDTDGDGVYDYEDACPDTPKGVEVDKRGCWVIEALHFDTEEYKIKPQDYSTLDEVVNVLKGNPSFKLKIEGHTDSRGTAAYNQKLSEKRAGSVVDYLVKAGIDSDRLNAVGYGFTMPVAPNNSPENMAKNRRVKIKAIR